MRQSQIAIVAFLLAGAASALAAEEPIIGGPCDGCEAVFEGRPASLASTTRIAPAGEPGEPMVIRGRVTDQNGAPAPGVIVYAYHTDWRGIYPTPNGHAGAARRHGRLRAWIRTDDGGNYRFTTIRPAPYPSREIPAHVHMSVIEPGRATYYIDDIVFDDDPLLTSSQRARILTGRGGPGLARPSKDERGVWQVRRDIVLGANIPGYRR